MNFNSELEPETEGPNVVSDGFLVQKPDDIPKELQNLRLTEVQDKEYDIPDEFLMLNESERLAVLSILSMPPEYQVVYTKNTNSYLLEELNSATYASPNAFKAIVNAPPDESYYNPLFLVKVGGPFKTVNFSNQDVEKKFYSSQREWFSHLEEIGTFNLPEGYRFVYAASKLPRKLSAETTSINFNFSGNQYGAVISVMGSFSWTQCVLKPEKKVQNVDIGSKNAILDALKKRGFFSVPHGCHLVAMRSCKDSIPVLGSSQVKGEISASGTATRNYYKNEREIFDKQEQENVDLTIKGKSDEFSITTVETVKMMK